MISLIIMILINVTSIYFFIYLGWADRCRKTREQTKILGERKSNISASIYINCLSVCLIKNVNNLVWITYKTPMGGQWPVKVEQFCPEKNADNHQFESAPISIEKFAKIWEWLKMPTFKAKVKMWKFQY